MGNINLRMGMIFKSKGSIEKSAFVVRRVYEKSYADGNKAVRVRGLLITGVNAGYSHMRDLDVRSMNKMFPVCIFTPDAERPEEDK